MLEDVLPFALCLFFILFYFLILPWGYAYWFERERKRETLIGCLSYMPQPGIEPATFWYLGQHSNQLSYQARAMSLF